MVQIVGNYEHVSNSAEFLSYLKALGAPEEFAKQLLSSKPKIAISEAGGVWSIKLTNGAVETVSNFKLGEPYEEETPDKRSLHSVTKREGNKLITDFTAPTGKKGTRVYEFNDAGFTMHVSEAESGQKATQEFKRV